MSKQTNNHEHTWTKKGLFIMCTVTLEEPKYYFPQGIVEVEYCTTCGLLRIPVEAENEQGLNEQSGQYGLMNAQTGEVEPIPYGGPDEAFSNEQSRQV